MLLPGLGWAAAGWLALRNRGAPQDKDAYLFEEDSPEDANPLAGLGSPEAIARELADARDVVPAVDALLSRDPGLKRGAIETLSRIRSPEAVAWLFRSRGEDDPEVRFYATTALTRLKREFDTAIRAAEREVYEKPGDPEPELALQRMRYEYAVSGMLEPAVRREILAGCRASLAPGAGRRAEAARLLFLVERELEPERAFAALEQAERLAPAGRARWTRERARLLYALGRYRELRALLAKRRAELEAGAGSERDWIAVLDWWAPREDPRYAAPGAGPTPA